MQLILTLFLDRARAYAIGSGQELTWVNHRVSVWQEGRRIWGFYDGLKYTIDCLYSCLFRFLRLVFCPVVSCKKMYWCAIPSMTFAGRDGHRIHDVKLWCVICVQRVQVALGHTFRQVQENNMFWLPFLHSCVTGGWLFFFGWHTCTRGVTSGTSLRSTNQSRSGPWSVISTVEGTTNDLNESDISFTSSATAQSHRNAR